jgi:hypothetical protein
LAQSRRLTADPAAIYAAHAAEARSEHRAAASDEARTHHDHAASAHELAARLLARVPRLQRSRAALQQAAAGARSGRNRNERQALYYESEMTRVDRAIAACSSRANDHYLRGLEHSAVARERAASTLSHEARVDAAAELVRAAEGDHEFRTAAQLRAQVAVPPPTGVEHAYVDDSPAVSE